MASARKIRQTVAAQMSATTLLKMSCLASSAQLERDSEAPLVTGNSHGQRLELGVHRGERPRAVRARPILKTFHVVLEETPAPAARHVRAGVKPGSDLRVGQPFGRQ